jgi:hypothetical protein
LATFRRRLYHAFSFEFECLEVLDVAIQQTGIFAYEGIALLFLQFPISESLNQISKCHTCSCGVGPKKNDLAACMLLALS